MKNMQIIDIHKAQVHLPRLVDEAAKGKSFFISIKGKAIVKVTPFNSLEARRTKRLGFMVGQISAPEDFDQMHSAEINQLWGDK
jgi:antitoxin (DNA-binding transcriptional repressor) of toxin-antitoxin stability system